jgi:hypothetical protein
MNQVAQDVNALKAGFSSAVQRAACKGSDNYRNAGWDLVDAVKQGRVRIEEIKTEDLPEEMQNLSVEQRKAVVDERTRERERIQSRITQLTAERNRYVADQMKQTSTRPAGSTLDRAIIAAVRKQAIEKEYQFD